MDTGKWITWITIAAMLLGAFAVPANAESEGALLFYIVSADDDSAWVRTNKGLMRFSSEGERIRPTISRCSALCNGPERAYLLHNRR